MSESAIREKYATPMPDAVKRRVAQVNEMLSGAAPPSEVPAAPVGGQEQPDSGGEGTPPSAEAGGGESQPTPAVTSVPAVTPPAEATPADDIESLKARLTQAEQDARTWKGRERKTREEMDALQRQIDELSSKLADVTKKPAPVDSDPLTEEDIANYGPDLLDATWRFIQPKLAERLGYALESISARLTALESGVGRVAAVTAKTEWEAFLERLDKRRPDWRTIDSSTAFTEWLDEEDPLMGQPRRIGLDAAARANDDVRAARFYDAFASQSGAPSESQGSRKTQGSTTPGEPPPAAPPAVTEPPAPTLEDFAAPGRPAPSPPTAPPIEQPRAKIWTVREITDYYRARAQPGHPHHSDHEARARMDSEIARAQAEGRVRAS